MIKPKTDLRSVAVLSLLAVSLGMTACSSNDDDGIAAVVPDVEVPDGEIPDVTVVDPDASALAGSYTITFTNTSDAQPMTPPVVALHNPITADNGIQLFVDTQPATGEIIEIAENGNNGPLAAVVAGQVTAGTISAGGVAFPDPENPGPLRPGDSASITLTPSDDTQVLSFVSMVVCTNDGFSGVDSRPLAEETFTTPIFDAGSETNIQTLNYWVGPCSPGGESPNIGDSENGAITAHPGQANSENPVFNFPAGSELLEVTIIAN